MLTLRELIENQINNRKIWIEKISTTENGYYNYSGNFQTFHFQLGILELTRDEIFSVKSNFFLCGLIDEFRVVKFNNRLLDYGLNHISLVLLSDNEQLILRYSKLRYQRGTNAQLSMDEMVAIGETAVWCNTVQFFMANDNEGVVRNLNILETITLKKLSKNQQELLLDYEFYKALLARDKAKMEEVLEKLVSHKTHKKRNDNPILNQYISLPALGYAKLAWRKGIEVEVNSPLVPKELLPIKPNESYEIPYDFLK
ncbi:MAG TPA: immunity 49 family protein [Tenuifilaceae bacterium]|nr:immunity 49 family protein [Tenuifilaceae bacterium]HOZ13621.1 immunity 49 family protein [Tenuifilaceae bacterium]HPI43598.1 immunity 49 family protein [Tenuifilaceae bacterium]